MVNAQHDHDRSVDLVEITDPGQPSGEARPGGTPDTIECGRRPDSLVERLWWRTAPQRARSLVGWTVVLLVVAGLVAVGAARQEKPVHEQVRYVDAPGVASGLDALGCPAGRRCSLRPSSALARAVAELGLRVEVLSSAETFDVGDGRVYRREFAAATLRPRGQLRVISQCAPTGVGTAPPVSVRTERGADGAIHRVTELVAVSNLTHCASFVRAVSDSATPVIGRFDALGSIAVTISRDPSVWVGYR